MTKLSASTTAKLAALPDADRAAIEAIVQRHITACHRLGVEIENIERVYLEAIDVWTAERDSPKALDKSGESPSWPETRYHQYVSPKDSG